MGSRHRAREAALKILYQSDLLKDDDIGRIIEDHLAEGPEAGVAREFVERLVRGVMEHRPEIDAKLGEVLHRWDPGRLGFLERTILRLGLYEMLFDPETPDKVAIDEAVELAKTFCDAESAGLINGALDKALRD